MDAAGRPTVSREPTAEMRSLVSESQRTRIVAAALHALASRGFYPLPPTVADLTTLAGCARNTFYEHFPNADEAFRAASDQALEHLGDVLLDGADSETLMRWVAENQEDAVVALIHSPAVNREGWARLFTIGARSTAEELERGAQLYLARRLAVARFDASGIREAARARTARRGRARKRTVAT